MAHISSLGPDLPHKSLMNIHPRELKVVVKDVPTLPGIYLELLE
jgi:hypothetical protein